MSTKATLHGLVEVAVASPLFLFAPAVRHWHMHWGATAAEVAMAMPGDDLVPQASINVTRAITVNAAPDAVWPWLVQIGYGKAGFYSYDLLDNSARPSADTILPQQQNLNVGEWVPMASKINETTAFRVKDFEKNRWLLWAKPHSTWAWKLEPLTDQRTRLVTRLKDSYSWRADPANALLSLILFEFGDFPMMRKLLINLKRRVEQRPAGLAGSQAERP
jgi:hypothetical protein